LGWFSGSFAQYLLSAISGHDHGAIIYLPQRLHHSSIHTERSYLEWIVRFVRFHGMRSRADLFPAEPKIEAFLTDLAVQGNVAAATQNQAINAWCSSISESSTTPWRGRINAVRAEKKLNAPVVRTREEVATFSSLLDGTAQLMAKLLYGSGLRIMEAVRVRVKDIAFQRKQLTVRSGKGDKDRFTTFLATLTPLLQNHLAGSRRCISRTWGRGRARSTSPMRSLENTLMPSRDGAGSISSPPGTLL
jgi:integrase